MSAARGHDAIPWQQAGTLGGLLRERVARTPEAIAYRFHRDAAWQALTWRQLVARVGCFQAALRARSCRPAAGWR